VGLLGHAPSAGASTHEDVIDRSASLSAYSGAATVGGSDGSVSYSYPFSLPAARGRYQPELALDYSSNGTGGPYGVGWSLSLPYVESSRRGSPTGASGEPREEFWLTLNGSSQLLKQAGTDGTARLFRPTTHDGFLELRFEGGFWTGLDGLGNRYEFSFGRAPNGVPFDGCSRSACTRWYLTRAVDVDGNATVYSWTPEGGPSALLTEIDYNLRDGAGAQTRVLLSYEPTPDPQSAAVAGGFSVHSQRLASVTVQNLGSSGYVTLLTYAMRYTASRETRRDELIAIAVTGLRGKSGPASTLFSYEGRADDGVTPFPGLGEAASIAAPGPDPSSIDCRAWLADAYSSPDGPLDPACTISAIAAWVDVDGDRRPDLVWGGAKHGIYWARNLTVAASGPLGFAPAVPLAGSGGFAGVVTSYHPTGEHLPGYKRFPGWEVTTSRVLDVNADGRPDLLSSSGYCGSSTSPPTLSVQFGKDAGAGPGFAAPAAIDVSSVLGDFCSLVLDSRRTFGVGVSGGCNLIAKDERTTADMLDLTGDGLPDLVLSLSGQWEVFPLVHDAATGAWEFGSPRVFASPTANGALRTVNCALGESGDTTTDLVDLNGDGIPDSVTSTSGPGSTWTVAFATGFGYTSATTWTTGDANVGPIGQSLKSSSSYDENSNVYQGQLVDVNGDGLVDYVHKAGAGTSNQWVISWNTGSGFAGGGETAFSTPDEPDLGGTPQPVDLFPQRSAWDEQSGQFVDVNGDGVPDYVHVTCTYGCTASDPVRFFFFPGRSSHASRPDLLASTVSPLGEVERFTYAPSTAFGFTPQAGAISPVAVDQDVFGLGLVDEDTRYWYADELVQPSWYDPAAPAYLGFESIWRQDSATKVVVHRVNSNQQAFVGEPVLVERGVPTGPGTAAAPPPFDAFERTMSALSGRGVVGTGCTSAPSPADFPLIPFTAQSTHTTIEDGRSFTSSDTIPCSAVDRQGMIEKATTDPDLGISGDEHTTTTAYDAAAACKSCPVRASDIAGGQLLTDAYFRYDPPTGQFDSPLPRGRAGNGHLGYVERLTKSGNYVAAAKTAYNADGTLAAALDLVGGSNPNVTTSYTYDPSGLHVTGTVRSDHSTSLATDRTYDPETGQLTSYVGPYLLPASGPPPETQRRYYGYDAFGRLLAIARQPIGAGLVREGIAAFAYDDNPPGIAMPRSQTAWTFAAPTDFTLGSAPDTDTAMMRITYYDGLGRPLQTRRRLGGASDAAAEAAAHLSMRLDGGRWLVTDATLRDGAGRTVLSFEPFYSSTGGYVDYWSHGERGVSDLHATVLRYDGESRPSCSFTRLVPWPTPLDPDDGPCASSFAPNSQYRLATRTTYDTGTLHGNTLLAVASSPPRETAPGAEGRAATEFLDASARTLGSEDLYGNLVEQALDPLGRVTASSRVPASGAGTPIVDRLAYDGLGRVLGETDPSFGTRTYTYLGSGRVARVSNPVDGHPEHVDYRYGSLGRLTRTDQTVSRLVGGSWQTTTSTSTLAYDTAYVGAPGSGPYAFTAGQLASAWNATTTIALGYDQDGNVNRRDQWFADKPGVHAVTRSFGNDGRLLSTAVTLPELPAAVVYDTEYDSLGRTVAVHGAHGYWSALRSLGGAGAYDALGRVRSAEEDDGNVSVDWTFAPQSSLPTEEKITVGTTTLYDLASMHYQAAQLTSASEAVSGTDLGYTYDHDDRLVRATASAGSSRLGQSYDERYSFALDKTEDPTQSAEPSLGNLERVTTALADRTYRYGSSDRVLTVTGSTPDTYSYDSRGMPTGHIGASTDEYEYDALGHLVSIANTVGGDTTRETLAYDAADALAQRTITDAAGTTTLDYVGADAVVATGKARPRAFVLAGGVRLAAIDARGRVLYYHRDRQGSVVATSLGGGTPGADYRYDPYGRLAASAGVTAATASDLGYEDALTLTGGLLHLNARDYDPALRRFLQPDTVDPLRYTYVEGDPANRVDPSGLYYESGASIRLAERYGLIDEADLWGAIGRTLEWESWHERELERWQYFLNLGNSTHLYAVAHGQAAPYAPASMNPDVRQAETENQLRLVMETYADWGARFGPTGCGPAVADDPPSCPPAKSSGASVLDWLKSLFAAKAKIEDAKKKVDKVVDTAEDAQTIADANQVVPAGPCRVAVQIICGEKAAGRWLGDYLPFGGAQFDLGRETLQKGIDYLNEGASRYPSGGGPPQCNISYYTQLCP